MGTQRQKKVAELIVKNATLDKPLNGGEILAKTGYAPGVIKNPSDILDSVGVKEELEILGFTESAAKQVVREIMLNTDADNSSRLKATDQVFKVLGSYAPEKREIKADVETKVSDMDLDKLAEEMAKRIKENAI